MPTDLGNEWYPDGINVDGANVHNECFPDGISVDGADVYITGWFLKYDYDKGADGHAVLWKAGEFRELSLLPGISYFFGPVMIVSDGHVYAAGQMDWRTAMVWKDGKTIPLSRPGRAHSLRTAVLRYFCEVNPCAVGSCGSAAGMHRSGRGMRPAGK